MEKEQNLKIETAEEHSRVSTFLLGFIHRMAYLVGGALIAAALKFVLYPFVLLPLYRYIFT